MTLRPPLLTAPRLRRRRLVRTIAATGLAAGPLGWSTAAGAAEWPAKPVRLIVPAPAGSSLDVIARMLSEHLREPWKQPVLVENKAGAGGMIGVGTVAKAPADGLQIAVGF
ncbi:MAG: tripartite tricarboxylate transporter substrate-binding protein, partial [Lautropia sp.]